MSKKILWGAVLGLFLTGVFLFPQGPSPNPALNLPVRFVTANPSGSCGGIRYITMNQSTGDIYGCVASTWQRVPAVTPSYVPAANLSGNSTKFLLESGTATSGNLVMFDANGNGVDAGVTPGSGGGSSLALIEQHTASTSSSLNFTSCISSTYDDYLIELIAVLPATDSTELYLRFSTDGGSTYDATSAHYVWVQPRYASNGTSGVGSSGVNGPTTAIAVATGLAQVRNTTANGGVTGIIRLKNPASTASYKFVEYHTSIYDGLIITSFGGGTYPFTTAVNAFRFIQSSGNLTSGTIRCYGIAKT